MPAKSLRRVLSAPWSKINVQFFGHMGALTATILSMACAPSTPGPEFNHPIPPQSHGFDGFLPDVERVVLENGMRVLVLPRQGIPTVSFVMQYGIGGIHERPGETGVAHLLEHMLFKGSETIGTTDVAAERVLFDMIDELHEDMVAAHESDDLAEVKRLEDEINRCLLYTSDAADE